MFSKIMDSPQNNFYNLLEIHPTSKSIYILEAYKNKINKFRNIVILDHNHISEIKQLKKGLYILLNKDLRSKYNNKIGLKKSLNEPLPMNHEIDNTLDSVFNIDNSWMTTHSKKNNDKKDNNEINVISDRIFSLSNFNKKPGYSTNDEIDLRKPMQGRVEKNLDKNN
jgi:hypothetical protein